MSLNEKIDSPAQLPEGQEQSHDLPDTRTELEKAMPSLFKKIIELELDRGIEFKLCSDREFSETLQRNKEFKKGEHFILEFLKNTSKFKRIDGNRIFSVLKDSYEFLSHLYAFRNSSFMVYSEQVTEDMDELMESLLQGVDKTSFLSQEAQIKSFNQSKGLIESFPYFSSKTLSNLTYLLNAKIIQAKEEKPITSEEMITEYKKTLSLFDRESASVFDSILHSRLRSLYKNKLLNLEMGSVSKFFKQNSELAVLLRKCDPAFMSAVAYVFNYLTNREKKYDLGLPLTADLIKALNEKEHELRRINKQAYYGIFMSTVIQEWLDRYQFSSQAYEGGKCMDDYLSQAIKKFKPFAKLVDQFEKNENFLSADEIKEIRKLCVNDFGGGDDYPSRWAQKKFKLLTQYSPKKFFNSLTLFCIDPKHQDHSKKEYSTRTCSDHYLLDNLKNIYQNFVTRAFLNLTLKSWELKQNTYELDKKILILSLIAEKQFTNPERFTLARFIDLSSNSEAYSYNARLLATFEFNHSAHEIIDCASIASPYMIWKKLGEGKGGKTYLIYSKELRQLRALKILEPETQGQENKNASKNPLIENPPTEAQLMARLQRKDLENIVQIYEAGDEIAQKHGEKRFAIVMEYVDGMTISEIVEKEKLTTEKVLSYSSQILNGIISLRNYGIIHRDLRPENIMVNKDGIVKIIDFGISTDQEIITTEKNRRYGGPTDFFSLALITYKMATGEHLLLARKDEVSTESYARSIMELKKQIYDEKHCIKTLYKERIQQNMAPELQNIVIACLESRDLEQIKKIYEEAREDLKYYFMNKEDLIQRIRQLEDDKK